MEHPINEKAEKPTNISELLTEEPEVDEESLKKLANHMDVATHLAKRTRDREELEFYMDDIKRIQYYFQFLVDRALDDAELAERLHPMLTQLAEESVYADTFYYYIDRQLAIRHRIQEGRDLELSEGNIEGKTEELVQRTDFDWIEEFHEKELKEKKPGELRASGSNEDLLREMVQVLLKEQYGKDSDDNRMYG